MTNPFQQGSLCSGGSGRSSPAVKEDYSSASTSATQAVDTQAARWEKHRERRKKKAVAEQKAEVKEEVVTDSQPVNPVPHPAKSEQTEDIATRLRRRLDEKKKHTSSEATRKITTPLGATKISTGKGDEEGKDEDERSSDSGISYNSATSERAADLTSLHFNLREIDDLDDLAFSQRPDESVNQSQISSDTIHQDPVGDSEITEGENCAENGDSDRLSKKSLPIEAQEFNSKCDGQIVNAEQPCQSKTFFYNDSYHEAETMIADDCNDCNNSKSNSQDESGVMETEKEHMADTADTADIPDSVDKEEHIQTEECEPVLVSLYNHDHIFCEWKIGSVVNDR